MENVQAFLGYFCCLFLAVALEAANGVSDPGEAASLLAIKGALGDGLNRLANWVGDDPCGTPQWTGVHCGLADGVQHVNELRLMNMNFTGILIPQVGNLTHLSILNFMWNNLQGPIPPEIGKLINLTLLLFDGNEFTGTLPPELGNLSKMNRLQIDMNNLTGPVPSSFQGLSSVRHIHLNNNSLTGHIPKELGQLPQLLHLLLDNNNMTGELPPELSNISTLVILQLDNNKFTGSIPLTYSSLKNLSKLSLRNCNLNGTIPDLSVLPHLAFLDLSQNRLSGSLPSLLSPSEILTTIDLSYNQLNGEVRSGYLHFQNLELLLLQNNSLDGMFSADMLTHHAFPTAESILLINLQNNRFSEFTSGFASGVPNVTIQLYGNPVCNNAPNDAPANLCIEDTRRALNFSTISVTTPNPISCTPKTCDGDRGEELVPGLQAQGVCFCAYPLVVAYRLKSPSFTSFPAYITQFIVYQASNLHIQEYQVHVSEYHWEPGPRLRMTIKLFPNHSVHEFEQDQVEYLFSKFSSWNFTQNNTFGPYELLSFFIGFPYNGALITEADGKRFGVSALAGTVSASVAFIAIVLIATIIAVKRHNHRQRLATKSAVKRRERIKVAGVKSFSYEDLKRATKNFDGSMQVGQGGYGRVYRGVLDDGLVVAIKRAEVGSLQGSKEFVTEIELLSRVHHRNLVSLVGFCDDEGEQMLVYEFMANGTLRDHLDSPTKAPLNFPSRLQIALGSAKGILYLHTEADPPIYHRDIKATNILLDDKRRAKVADFGLSKLAPIAPLEGDVGGYISTVVKGTPGYLDPEYFFTHMLTDKSDVYSFGVVLLELATGLQPIYNGKNLVREVTLAKKSDTVLDMVDSRMGEYTPDCMMSLIEIGLECTQEDMKFRPGMADVVSKLTAIWQATPKPDPSMAFSEEPEKSVAFSDPSMERMHMALPQPSSSWTTETSNSTMNFGIAPR